MSALPWLDLGALLLVVLAAMASPGPDMLLVARYALRSGAGAALACIAGIVLGIAAHLAFALTGLATLARTAPGLLDAVRLAGAAWLAWLGIGALRATGGFRLETAGGAPAGPPPFLAGLLSNLLNVKVLLMMLALFTQLLGPSAPLAARLLGAGLLLLEVFTVWSAFAVLVRRPAVVRFVERRAATLDHLFGGLLLLLAVLVALAP